MLDCFLSDEQTGYEERLHLVLVHHLYGIRSDLELQIQSVYIWIDLLYERKRSQNTYKYVTRYPQLYFKRIYAFRKSKPKHKTLIWWYDRRLSTYNPGLVGRTRVDSFNGTSVQVCTVSFFLVLGSQNLNIGR